MTKHVDIEIVSDVVCPWCVIGIRGLELALAELGDAVSADLRLRAFELNPAMPPGGQDIGEHLAQKYGSTPDNIARMHETVRARAEAVGFAMRAPARTYNTFAAHRALYWAGLEGKQMALKQALLAAYFARGENPSDPDVLARAAEEAGLDPARARAIAQSDDYASEVRAEMEMSRRQGVTAVPTFIIDQKYAIQGGQPPEAFARALREIAAQT